MKNKEFSLRDAAAQAFRDYPDIQETTMFAYRHDVLADPARAFIHCNPALLHSPLTDDRVTGYFSGMAQRTGSFVTSNRVVDDNGTLTEQRFILTLDTDNMKIDPRNGRHAVEAAIFHHELAHIITPAGQEEESQDFPVNETAADGYAILRHIHDNDGDLSLPRSLMWCRAAEAIEYNDTSHLSVLFAARIIRAAAHGDRKWLKAMMGPTDALSETAYAMTPDPAMTARFREYYRPSMGMIARMDEDSCFYLAQTALAAPDKFLFSVGARLFQPFLNPDGAWVNDRHVALDRKTRNELAAAFIARAQVLGEKSIAEDFASDGAHYHAVQHGKNRGAQAARFFKHLRV